MFDDKNLRELRSMRFWLMDEIDSIERGDAGCTELVYIKLLTRLYMVDLEIRRREYAETMLRNRSAVPARE